MQTTFHEERKVTIKKHSQNASHTAAATAAADAAAGAEGEAANMTTRKVDIDNVNEMHAAMVVTVRIT